MTLRRKLREAFAEGYATGLTGAPPDPGATWNGQEIDWCRMAGWHQGNSEFKANAARLRLEAFGFDPEKAR